MSHSTVLVTLKDSAVAEHGIEGALADALEKFDENKETERYVKLTKEQAIEAERQSLIDYRDGLYAEYLADPAKYAADRKNGAHLTYISEEFPKKLEKLDDDEFLYAEAIRWESESSIDENGGITSTYNPHSKWDWYSIGGRWSKAVLNTTGVVHHPAKEITPTWTEEAWDENTGGTDYLRKRDLDVCHGTFAFLDADGEWHERGRMGWFGIVTVEKATPDEWVVQLKGLIEKVDDDDWLVVVDVHI
jgi:hypothetical protein